MKVLSAIKNFFGKIFKRKDAESEMRTPFTLLTAILCAVLVIYVISLLWPLFWALITSFKKQSEFRINIVRFPKEWTWNYSLVFEAFSYPISTPDGEVYISMGEQFLNSALYSIGCSFTATLVPCVTAYLCAKFPYKFSKVIYTVVIVTMVLPIIGSLPSEISIAKALGFYDQIWGLWLMKANFLGLYFLVFYGIFQKFPSSYAEAAKIDGAGNMSILVRIVLPLVSTTFFTVMIINFIGFWNDYSIPLVYLPSYPTIALGMFNVAHGKGNAIATVPMRMTGAVLMLVPILAIFLCTHKQLLGNLTVGGIKG